MSLTRSRLTVLKAIHGYELIASLSKPKFKPILRWLSDIDKQIEKLKYSARWRANRIAMLREVFARRGPPPPPPPLPSVPDGYRSTKISHWYKDHLQRIGDMASDAACCAGVGLQSDGSPDRAIGAFNAHIAPIAKLYGFRLEMKLSGDDVVLRGDIDNASCVLLYLCSQRRTPEIDWLLDTVRWFQVCQVPFDWKKAWNKLRHTKRGQWWRKQRGKQIDAGKARTASIPKLETQTLGPKIGRINERAIPPKGYRSLFRRFDDMLREGSKLDPELKDCLGSRVYPREDEKIDLTGFTIFKPHK